MLRQKSWIKMNYIDLHSHSEASDGALTPTELVSRAVEKGACALALTDHDCLLGLAEARAAAEEAGLPFVEGVEVSVSWRSKHTIHIVGLGIDPACDILVDNLIVVRQGRQERLRAISDLLEKEGIYGVFDGAISLASNPDMVGRAHAARYMVSQGVCKDTRSVFRHYMVSGKPGYVPHQWAKLDDAVSWIRKAGGIAVIAHPGRYDLGRTLMRELITEFKDVGGEALEVSSASHSLDERIKFALYANEFSLLASAGSDFHVPDEPGREVGVTPDIPASCTPVWTKLSSLKSILNDNN